MPTHRFQQVDVFTQIPFRGNPVAVVLEAEGLTDQEMQQIAAWTNLSETTFVLPPSDPTADYRLRIFTPKQELPFAGHPTLGSAHAVLESGLVAVKPVLRQECAAGIIPISVEASPQGRRIFAAAPPASVSSLDNDVLELLSEALEPVAPPPLRIDVGAVWIVANLGKAEAVAALTPNLSLISQISEMTQATGVTVFGQSAEPDAGLFPPSPTASPPAQMQTQMQAQMQVRSFAPLHGIAEDPVCGSGNVSVAAFLLHSELLDHYGVVYTARQGMQVGRDGQIFMRVQDQQIEFGGHAVTCIAGQLSS
ncbi:MAG: PhzF family phenazine biosynthesis protein [Elainella sp.]